MVFEVCQRRVTSNVKANSTSKAVPKVLGNSKIEPVGLTGAEEEQLTFF